MIYDLVNDNVWMCSDANVNVKTTNNFDEM